MMVREKRTKRCTYSALQRGLELGYVIHERNQKSHTLRKYSESTFVEPDPVQSSDPRGQV